MRTVTVKADRALMSKLKAIFDEELATISDAACLQSSFIFQAFSKELLAASAANGPNALGLSPSEGPLMRESTDLPLSRMELTDPYPPASLSHHISVVQRS